VRSRSLFVRHAPLRRLRRRLPSTGILGPLAVAVVLAVAGSQLDENATRAAAARTAAAPPAVTLDVPVRGLGVADFPERVVRGTTIPSSALAAKAPARTPARASRSRTRPPAPRKAWVRSCNGPLTSYFGMRWGRMHKGLDFGCSYGAPIFAASDGVVTYAGPEGGYGRLVTIRHDGGWVTAYGHMSRFAVRSGQRVRAGQVIAYVGSAGHSTGPHLHFEVRTAAGGWINPLPFLRARGVRV
jgi:murein DD-endopeptidase MepM/ murein hydrolase activator NlpD